MKVEYIPQVIQSNDAPNHRVIASFVNQVEVCKFKFFSNSAISMSSVLNARIVSIPFRDEERWLNIGERVVASILCTDLGKKTPSLAAL